MNIGLTLSFKMNSFITFSIWQHIKTLRNFSQFSITSFLHFLAMFGIAVRNVNYQLFDDVFVEELFGDILRLLLACRQTRGNRDISLKKKSLFFPSFLFRSVRTKMALSE